MVKEWEGKINIAAITNIKIRWKLRDKNYNIVDMNLCFSNNLQGLSVLNAKLRETKLTSKKKKKIVFRKGPIIFWVGRKVVGRLAISNDQIFNFGPV